MMNIKKVLVSASVAILAATAMSFSAVSAEGLPSKAYLCGTIGATNIWQPEGATAGSKVADVNGDAQYEVEWAVTDGGTSKVEFLAVSIPDLTTEKYPNLKVTLDKVFVDGIELANYKASANAINMSYKEEDLNETRIYLHDSIKGANIADLPAATTITKSLKVQFTVSGTGVTGTSNVTAGNNGANGATTTAPVTTSNNGSSTTVTTTIAVNNMLGGGATTTAAVLGNSVQTNSATTGDTGAAIAVAGLVLTSGIAATAVMLRKK